MGQSRPGAKHEIREIFSDYQFVHKGNKGSIDSVGSLPLMKPYVNEKNVFHDLLPSDGLGISKSTL